MPGNKLLSSVKSAILGAPEKKNEKQTSGAVMVPLKPKLPYNPYGLNGLAPKIENSALADDIAHPVSLADLSVDINDYLPAEFKQETTNFEAKYKDLQQDYIGNGGSAMIRRVVRKNSDDGVVYALKKFAVFRNESVQSYCKRTTCEFILTHSMHHLHVVDVLEMVKLQLEIPRTWGMIMLNYPCDFYKIIKSPKWKYTSIEEKLCCFKQIAIGLRYIHEEDICHLDLKPDNILVTKHGVLKITDFGCSVVGHEIHGDFNSPIVQYKKLLGTPPYQAPETTIYKFTAKSERKPYCPFKFDYYSLGLMLFVIIVSKAPFVNSHDSDSNFKKYHSDYTNLTDLHPAFLQNDANVIPRGTRSLFANSYGFAGDWVRIWWRLADPNPETRMTLRDLFHDEWFQSIGVCIDELEYQCNFIHHNYLNNKNDFQVLHGQESQNEKVHRHGGGIRRRSSTILRHRSTSCAPAMNSTSSSESSSYRYTSLIPKDVGANTNHFITQRRSSLPPSHSLIMNGSNATNHNNTFYLNPNASTDKSSHSSSISECHSKNVPTTDDNSRSFDTQPLVSLQKLNLGSENTTEEKHTHFNQNYNFYYPDGETMHFEFTKEDYADPNKFMVIPVDDVESALQNVVSHEHYSIMETI